MSKSVTRNIFIFIVCSFIFAWVWFLPGAFNSWHLQANDALFRLRYHLFGMRRVYPFISHVNIDDESIEALGTSVEATERYTKIVEILTQAYAGAIIFDMVVLKSEEEQGKEQSKILKDQFQNLVKAVGASGTVYFPVILHEDNSKKGDKKEKEVMIGGTEFPKESLWALDVPGADKMPQMGITYLTEGELLANSKGVGHINCTPDDEDGIYRRYSLFFRHKNGFIPSVSFRALCDVMSVPPEKMEVKLGKHIIMRDAHFPDGRTKDITIPIDSQARVIINYCGPWDAPKKEESFQLFKLKKLYEVIEDDDKLDRFIDDIEEQLVIVANTFAGQDMGPIPLKGGYQLPGLHSTVINSILTESFLREISNRGMLCIDAALVILLFIVALKVRAKWLAPTAAVIVALFFAGTTWLFLYQDILINAARSLTGIGLSIGSVSVYKYLCEEREKTLLRAKFENYFAPSLLNKILESPGMLDVRQKKVITILFSDIAGFTAWSSTRQPEEIHTTLNEYFEEMASIVFKYEGTIDKYIGDGLMVFFGDPVEHKDHALRAVKAAIEMQEKTRALKAKWEPEGRMAIRIRIGINTGEAVVGNMGSVKRVDYTAIGAHVNMTQRLESNAPVEGILVSEPVYEQIKDHVEARPAGKIKAKGFEHEIEVYEVVVG